MADPISGSVLVDLKKYLLAHEDDILYGINDFGDLLHAFYVIVGRAPKEHEYVHGSSNG